MDDLIACPECGRQLRLPETFADQQVRCPGCAATFRPERRNTGIQEESPPPEDYRVQDRPSARPDPRLYRDDPFEDHRRRDHLPDELPGGGLTIAVMVLLGLTIADSLVQIGVDNFRLQQVGKPINPMAPQAVEEDFLPTDCLTGIVLVPTGILFCMWMYRNYKNLLDLRVRGLRYSPGWAAGAFFVPILNLYRPYQIAQEMWRASAVPDKDEDALSWRDRRGAGLISVWWAFWLISGIIGSFSFRISLHPGEAETALTIGMFAEGLSIVAALCAIGMIRSLRKRQVRMLEELRQS